MKITPHTNHLEPARKAVQGRWGDLIRFSVVTVWAIYVVVMHYSDYQFWLPMVAYSVLSGLMLLRQRFFKNRWIQSTLPVVVDALFLSYIVHLFGSTTSQIAVYYLLVLIGYHATEPAPVRRSALILTIVGYGTILILERLELLPWYVALGRTGTLPPLSDAITHFFKIAIALMGAYAFLSISTRKIEQFIRNEKALRESTRKSEEKTEELQKQIESAQRLESLGRLAGGVAHDFNNLLTGILTYAQFLKEDVKTSNRSLRDVEKIINATRQASVLTSQLLTFGRKQMVRPKILNLNKIVANIQGTIRGAIGPNIRIRQDFCHDLGNIKADSALIKQVILNLVVNARDAMPDGGTLTIRSDNLEISAQNLKEYPELSPGPHIKLCIEDTGEGISEENIEKIFDPFFTTKHGEHASGLGLSSVYGVVRQANGHVHAQSTLGKGTTIQIIFPRVFESASVITAPQPIIPGGRETILLVEDEEMVRTSVSRILKRQNYSVLSAANGEEAIEIFDQSAAHINLILTDVIMTGITGEALADHIHTTHPHLPVLFMSGYTEDAIADKGILKEGTAFLPKPFSSDELLMAVSKTLAKAAETKD